MQFGKKKISISYDYSYSAKTCSIGIKSHGVLMTQILYKFGPKETPKRELNHDQFYN